MIRKQSWFKRPYLFTEKLREVGVPSYPYTGAYVLFDENNIIVERWVTTDGCPWSRFAKYVLYEG